jgi:hypothetical protein
MKKKTWTENRMYAAGLASVTRSFKRGLCGIWGGEAYFGKERQAFNEAMECREALVDLAFRKE